jgi:hypothetical protein
MLGIKNKEALIKVFKEFLCILSNCDETLLNRLDDKIH